MADQYSCLYILPDELLLKILSCNVLSIQDLVIVARTCTRLKRIVDTQNLWRIKLKQQWWDVWEELPRSCKITDWREEVKQLVCFRREVYKLVSGLSPRLYQTSNLTTPVYQEIDALALSTEQAPLYMTSALRRIIKDGPEYKNLTIKHYALKIMSHVHQELCIQEWREFLALPPPDQSLEIGAVYMARWFQPHSHVTVAKVVSKLDSIAEDVRNKLSTQHPDHPVLTQPLLPTTTPLRECRWSQERCRQIFRCLNHVLFYQIKMTGNNDDYYNLTNSLINELLESKRGIPITLSIVYAVLCHRLGVLLQPINNPRHFLMGWKVPGTDDYEYIDAFNKGRHLTLNELLNELPREERSDYSHPEPCTPAQVFLRMIRNIMNVAQMQLHVSDHLELFCPATELMSLLMPEDRTVQELLLRIYCTLKIHYDRIVAGCEELLAKGHSLVLQEMLEEARLVLQEEREQTHPLPITPHASRTPDVKFATGLIMRHKRYHYTCVIFGWDKECKMPDDWVRRMGVHNLEYKKKQPFYNVLVSDGSHRYAAQENLEVSVKPKPVSHGDVGKYFQEFTGSQYIPNPELTQEYPEDEGVRLDLLREVGL